MRRPMASNSELQDTSFLTGANAAFIEELYDRYVADPDSVDESWRDLFDGLRQPTAPAQAVQRRPGA